MAKIAIVSRGWYPFVHGGADKFIARLAEKLSQMKHDVIAITRGMLTSIKETSTPYRMIIIRHQSNLPLVSSALFSFEAARIVNRLKPDIVIVNGYWAEASPIFINKKIPVILIIHDVGLFRSSWARKHRLKHMLRTIVLRKNIERASRVVVPTEPVREDIIRFLGIGGDKIIVLGTEGVDDPFEYRLVNNGLYDIVQVARFAPNKGQIYTLKAFKKLIKMNPNARLWLVGGAPHSREQREYFNVVKDLAKEINQAVGVKAVKIIVDAPDVGKYYELADVCVATSTGEEGYGLALVECMAHGKPVIASPIFEKTGVVDRDRALIIDPRKTDELAEAFIRLSKDKDLYDRLSRNALEYARRCSWDNVAKVFSKIIKEIIMHS
ncbi:MAG: glycosyltransferase family 4 protein [Crenarchaeota archaeon]|nr:glycosyltransferase family 4 protein [Thermoproteota archaeon]